MKINDQKQPIRTRESIQPISGYIRERRNKDKNPIETRTVPNQTKNETATTTSTRRCRTGTRKTNSNQTPTENKRRR